MVGFHTGRLDREVALAPGAECGLALKRVGEWAVIVGTPPSWGGGKARVGDVLAAVDGASALLGGYEAMFRPVRNPKFPTSFEIRFNASVPERIFGNSLSGRRPGNYEEPSNRPVHTKVRETSSI